MAEVIPFRGLVYRPTAALGQESRDASSLLAPPYDVIGEAERRSLAGQSAFNSVHLILPQPPVGADGDARYAVAGATLLAWQRGQVAMSSQPFIATIRSSRRRVNQRPPRWFGAASSPESACIALRRG